jgi:precorrin-2 dehydrogenase / sirohydrochlorin ferrochelatase
MYHHDSIHMTWYPIFLDLRGRKVLVAGAGKVALRKVKGLLEAGAIITLIAPEFDSGFDGLDVNFLRRKVRSSDAKDFALVFAATNDRAANRRLAAAALERGIPANVADSSEECTFLVPARIIHGDIQVAVSTGGRNPRLAVKIRDAIKQAMHA